MTRKDFEALARVLRESEPSGTARAMKQWVRDVESVASVCASSNPRFDKDKFYRACNLPEMADN